MEMVLMLGGVVLGAAVMLVFLSNIYLELASRRARRRRLPSTLPNGVLTRSRTNPLGLRELDVCS